MQIIRCDSSHDAEWNTFVRARPSASFYHLAEWRAINQLCFGHASTYLAALRDGAIVGVFPLVRLKSAIFGNIACSMPFVNYGGPCAVDDEAERGLLEEAGRVADEWNVDYLEIRSQRYLGDAYRCSEHKVSMTIELTSDSEHVWNAFKTGHRNEIRRAYKHGFTAKFGPDLIDDFYAVLSESWRDLGTPIYSISYLKAVLAAFPETTRLCVVYAPDGTPAAGALDGIHNDTVEGMWLGMRSQYRKQLIGYVLYWELVKNACERGFTRFHLGRSSKDSGAEQFKKKWNAVAQQLYWHYLLRRGTEIPSLSHSNPKYELAIKAWRVLPVSVTQMLGPIVSRSIP